MDYEKFHEDFIPKSCLPMDYGGDLQSVEDLHSIHSNELFRLREYFYSNDKTCFNLE